MNGPEPPPAASTIDVTPRVQSGEIGREAVFAFFVAGCGYSGKKPRERTDVAEQLARRQAFFIPLDLDAGYRRILLVQPER
jgi:hypothetical protein